MANNSTASAKVGVQVDLKELEGQLRTASNMIGKVTDDANRQGGSKGGLFGRLLGDTGAVGSLSKMGGVFGTIGRGASNAAESVGSLGAAFKGGGGAAVGAGAAIVGVVATIAAAIVVVKGLQLAFQGAMATIESAGKAQASSRSFENLAKNLQISTGQVQQFRAELQKLDYEGVEQTDIMNNLTQALGANGLSKEALNATKAMRDLSVAAGVSSKQGIGIMANAVSTLDTTTLRSFGVLQTAQQLYETYAATIGKSATNLSVAEKQHAILNGVIAAGAANMGLADKAGNDYNRLLVKVKSNFEALKATVGQVFLPLASGILGIINTEISNMSSFVGENENKFQSVGQAIAGVVVPAFQALINWIKAVPWVGIIDGIYRTVVGLSLIAKIASLPFKILWSAARIAGLMLATVGVAIERTGALFAMLGKIAAAAWSALTGQSSVVDFVNNANSAIGDFASSTGNVLKGLYGEWNQTFEDLSGDLIGTIDGIVQDVGKLGKGFKIDEWFAGLPKGVADAGKEALGEFKDTTGGMSAEAMKAAKKMAEELAKENADFARNQANALRDYKEQLAELVAQHRDQIRDINNNIKKEQDQYEKSYAERTRSYQDELSKLNKEDDDRKKDVNTQIAEELAKGRFADKTRLASLRARLQYEDAEHKKAVEEANSNYETDVENSKASHEERLAELQTQLDKELGIQKRHQEDFNTYRDYQIKDDITKLKEQYARRVEEDTRAHQERLASIIQQGAEQAGAANTAGYGVGEASGMGYAAGLGSQQGAIDDLSKKIGKSSGDKVGQGVSEKKDFVGGSLTGMLAGAAAGLAIGSIFGPVGALVGAVIGGAIGNSSGSIGKALKGMFDGAVNILGNLWDWGKKIVAKIGEGLANAFGSVSGVFKKAWTSVGLPGFATGGIVGGTPGKDTNVVAVTRGEMILNKNQQQRMFSLLNGRSEASSGSSSSGIIIQNMNVSLPSVRNANDFEREMKLKFATMRG